MYLEFKSTPTPLKVGHIDLSTKNEHITEAFSPLVKTSLMVPEFTDLHVQHGQEVFASLSSNCGAVMKGVLPQKDKDILEQFAHGAIDLIEVKGIPLEKEFLTHIKQANPRRTKPPGTILLESGQSFPMPLTDAHTINIGLLNTLHQAPAIFSFGHISRTMNEDHSLNLHQDGGGIKPYGILTGLEVRSKTIPRTVFVRPEVQLGATRLSMPARSFAIEPGKAILFRNDELKHEYVAPENAPALRGRRTLLRCLAMNAEEELSPPKKLFSMTELESHARHSRNCLVNEVKKLEGRTR